MIEIDEIFNNIDAHRVKNSREFFPLLFKLQIRLQDYKKKTFTWNFHFALPCQQRGYIPAIGFVYLSGEKTAC